MSIHFFVPGIPATQGSKKHVGGGRIIDTCKRLPEWRKAVAYHAAQARTEPIYDGAVAISMTFVMPRAASHFGMKGLRSTAPEHHTKKPDLTKMQRAVEDALTGIIFTDDARVVRIESEKIYCQYKCLKPECEHVGVTVEVKEVG